MEKKLNEESQGKRNFLKIALTASAAMVAGILIPKKILQTTGPEKIKFLTADGKLVEIDPSKIKSKPAEKASEKDIRNWMQTDKTNKPL